MAKATQYIVRTLSMGAVALTLGATVSLAQAAEVTGAGSSAIYPVLSKWAETYKANTGNSVNYQSIGSGGGIAQIKAKTVAFGATDMPLEPAELDKNNLAQFPGVIIGIVPVMNVPGIAPGSMVFNGQVLADIYLGKITQWNDPALKALNPRLPLPDMRINVVHRSDGSGTTFNFTNYLSKVSPEWKSKVGEGTAVSWPTGVGGKGNAGVAAYVQKIKGAIGYVEYAYALQNKIAYGLMKNKAGNVVRPDDTTFQAAAANADWSKTRDFFLVMTDQPGKDSWPITATTWLLVRKDAPAAQNKEVIDFARWFLNNGQQIAKSLDYVPFPATTVKQIEGYWKAELKI
ncbi:phosphate ABC transporter substrate-binding protein PstS [Thermithiobacillus tepidarius DSM 3134]|uniref:phosphate ABC transporter substrate-binding protein PstS n=1 Tax=Thermithiobacillus tepidarius TaxID=929 RepID=UPI000418A849|nr:phosphate ABC transporter substrate-binding protein PstS [Thermithiobacillus tepidarius]